MYVCLSLKLWVPKMPLCGFRTCFFFIYNKYFWKVCEFLMFSISYQFKLKDFLKLTKSLNFSNSPEPNISYFFSKIFRHLFSLHQNTLGSNIQRTRGFKSIWRYWFFWVFTVIYSIYILVTATFNTGVFKRVWGTYFHETISFQNIPLNISKRLGWLKSK